MKDPETAEVVKTIFEAYLQGEGTYAISLRLMDMQVPTPSDRQPSNFTAKTRKRPWGDWAAGTIQYILKSPCYKGEYTQRLATGTVIVPVPEIVPPTVWQRVQELLPTRRRGYPSPNATTYMLRGTLHCGHCGASYTGSRVHQQYSYYRCIRKNSRLMYSPEVCPMPAFRKDHLERVVWDWLDGTVFNEKHIREAVQARIDSTDDEAARLQRQRASYVQQLADLDAEELDTYELHTKLKRPMERIQPLLERIDRLRASAQEALARVEAGLATTRYPA